ncbi:hypothetical protein FO433_02580 [Weissella cibaria]|uniref:hypothetical protein n=1 Tax=Weissella cibaria TaxID=137591 RepID=UPI001191943C|nr:hypothetical protein [Weissella cibaria]TVV24759.1 hypothetical protein FO433_02580 [Weissella cibaria]
MANKFTNFIFTTEGKDTITQVLAAKKVAANAQLSINTVYTFATKLSTSLVYTQISSLGPKQTKPVGTVTPQDNDTVEMRIQLDNADLTTGYNLQGVAIVGQYNGNNFVLGYINSNETTNIPPYDGTQVQTVALDVSFAISDSNIVTINTQTAGMLTVDDYNALVKLLEIRVAPLAVDSTVVHLTGSEVVTGIKQFTERIVGSVTGNAQTADYLNVHNLTADISLDTLSDNGSYLSKSNTKVTTGKPSGTSELYTLIVAGTMQLFNDMSNDALYVRNRIDSKTMTSWKKIVEDVDQTLNAKYNYAQLPTVNGSGVALQSDLAAETSSRSVADRDLKASIALEAQTRSAADIAFGSSLAAEVAARSTADASVTAAMNKEQVTRSTADASIVANLTTETSARSAADTSLQALYSGLNSDFNAEIATRSAADSLLLGSTADLASQIAKERDNRVFNDNSLASDIASNATKRDELFGSMLDWNMSNANSIAANSVAINSVNAATMHLSGSETVTGQKNFKGTQSFENLSVSGYTDVFGPLTAKGDFWVNGSWNGESRKLNTVYNTDPQISYNAAAKAVGWGNGTGSSQLIRIKNGWVSIYIAFTTNKAVDYGIATEIGKITNKDFPLPWGTGSAYGTAIDVTTSAFVGTLIIDTSGVLTINMSSGTIPVGEYLTVNAQYAY